jgi:glycosyltransferase involved in cell wall biosynthesis
VSGERLRQKIIPGGGVICNFISYYVYGLQEPVYRSNEELLCRIIRVGDMGKMSGSKEIRHRYTLFKVPGNAVRYYLHFLQCHRPTYLKPEYKPDTGIMQSPTLSDLPSPTEGKTGWPWTEMSHNSGISDNENCKWPRISIVTPSFNQGQFIEETIRSVLLQDYPNLEYIVIDGGSIDSTRQILKKYNRYITWISEPDEGQTDAINKGLKMASGEIVAYLNSDDIYEPGALMSVARLFCQWDNVAMIYGDIIHIDERSEFLEFHKTGDVNLKQYLMVGEFYLPQPSVFFRKNVINSIGYFNRYLHLAMDYDYWLKIIINFKTRYEPITFSRARIYPQAKSSALDYKYCDEILAIFNSLFKEHNLEQYRKDAYGFVHFVGGLTFMKRCKLHEAVKHFGIAFSIDPRYLFHPYLYWSVLEVSIGERNARKIRPRIKRIINKVVFGKSYNIFR